MAVRLLRRRRGRSDAGPGPADPAERVGPFSQGPHRPFRGRWSIFAGFWLVFLAYPLGDALDRAGGRPDRIALAVAGFAAFCACYLFLPLPAMDRPEGHPSRYAMPVALLALGTALLPLAGQAALICYVYVISASIVLLRPRAATAYASATIGLAMGLSLTVPGWSEGLWNVSYSLLATALAVGGFSKMLRTARELLAAREELARLAVAEERVRFARDLHDILGHSLTVITVKAGLANRLIGLDPARAQTEVADIERLSRAALSDVRATVAGYRQVSLATELASARQVLEAAGIRAELPHAVDEVPAEWHELLGWAVREGVTNVVRHSAARTCAIRVWAHGVEVDDDGTAGVTFPGAAKRASGTGLTGLSERVAQAGGRLVAGRRPDGGFRLRVSLPGSPDEDGGNEPAGPAEPAPAPGWEDRSAPDRTDAPAGARR